MYSPFSLHILNRILIWPTIHRTSQSISSHWRPDFSVTISSSELEQRYKSTIQISGQDRCAGGADNIMKKTRHPLWQVGAEGRTSARRGLRDDGWQRTNQGKIKHTGAQRNSGLFQLRTFTRFIRQPCLPFYFEALTWSVITLFI